MPNVVTVPDIKFVSRPTQVQVERIAREMVRDPGRKENFTDEFPSTIRQWRHWIATEDFIPFLCLIDGTPAILHWAHDTGTVDDETYAWVGSYAVRAYRGKEYAWARKATFDSMVAYYKGIGFKHLFGAVRTSNIPALRYVLKIGWHAVGTFYNFARFQGKFDACELVVIHPADAELIWRVARARVAAYRREHF